MVPLAVCCLILLLISLILFFRLLGIKHALGEIHDGFLRHLDSDTNVLIDVSSRDRDVRRLAAGINRQLRALRHQRQRYQQGDLELKEAITGISHDLRTPLTAILGYLDLMDTAQLSPENARYLRGIRERSESMRELTEELLQYSVVSSAQPLTLQAVDLGRALEETLLSFYGTMVQKSIQPEIRLPEQKLIRQLDPGALNRILSNIISNALKYSGGDLTVTLEEDGRIRFSNTAPGLPPVVVGRLFDRFYTVESSRNSTGLGLSIARHLTQQMGGEITAQLEGELFSIVLFFPE